jgi:DNA-binding transcriptional LysR family regulator
LQLNPLASLEQIDAIRSGRLDAGFVFNMPKTDPKVDHVQVARQNVALAAPKGHPVAKLKTLRLRDLVAVSLISFPRRESPAFYDRLMHECFRGGLKSPHIVQEAVNEVTILSLVSHGMGVGFVTAHALAVSSRMEDRQWIPIARKICPRCSRLTGSPSIGECS